MSHRPTCIAALRRMGLMTRLANWCCLAWLCCVALLAGAAPAYAAEIHLYVSPTTTAHFAAKRKSYSSVIQRWHPYLQRYGEHAQALTREELLSGLANGVLILPTAVALDNAERQAITRFVDAGGAVLGTGPVGMYDETGRNVGTGFLERTFRVRTHGYFAADEDTFYMPFGGGPLTWPVPAARRMWVDNPRDSLLRISGANEAAVAMDWSRAMQTEPHAVMAFEDTGKSRLAYIAVPDDAWAGGREPGLILDATLAWLRREPQAFKAAWPNGHVACHLIEMDTEDKFESAPNFAKDLENEGFKGTFYSLTTEAVRLPQVVQDLQARGHEIAYHADVHFGFKGEDPAQQELRIKFMQEQMRSILGERAAEATGFRAPTESYDATTESYDATTERLLRKYGIRHHAADESAHEDRLPFFSTAEPGLPPDQALVVLPRTQMDDVTFINLKLAPAQVTAILDFDLSLAVRSGSLSLLSVHSQNYVEGGLMLAVMGDYMRKVATYRDRLWVARGDEIARWWRLRDATHVDQRWNGAGIEVTLDNTASAPVDGLTVFVTLPFKGAAVRVAGTTHGIKTRVKPIDAYRAAVVVDRLPTGSSRLQIRF